MERHVKKIAFTICAKNYIGLAQTLGTSINFYNEDVLFLIFIADELTSGDLFSSFPDNVILAKDAVNIPTKQWYEMCFKYDITEFCTSIKPSCFKYIFEKYEPESCIYFDPDILVFNRLDSIYEELNTFSIILTPHITLMEEVYTGKLSEQSLLYSGIYNLGFLALKNDSTSIKMLNWWTIRLKDRCYQNKMESYFTDQKWMDFLPAFFPNQLFICTDLGMNLAPWNFYERTIVVQNKQLLIKNRIDTEDTRLYPLIFVHFSGFNYAALLNDTISQDNIGNLDIPADLRIIFEKYKQHLIKSDFAKFISQPYTYGVFSNEVYISIVYRRLFRRLLEDGKIDNNPFLADGPFYFSLKKAGVITENMASSDKASIGNVADAEKKILIINRFFFYLFKITGAKRFFTLTRLMRLYSKHENHIYLIDKSYLKRFKIRN